MLHQGWLLVTKKIIQYEVLAVLQLNPGNTGIILVLDHRYLPGCTSVEPGIYWNSFGVRLQVPGCTSVEPGIYWNFFLKEKSERT